MLTITPIGSCRIATPLRLGRQDLGYAINGGRLYGYSHSASEAVQQMRYLKGEYTPSTEVWPLIAPGTPLAVKNAETHEESDIYVVEVSSAKTFALGGEFVQLNYLRRHFADFFADVPRTLAYMRLCRARDRVAMRDFLGDVWGATARQRKEAAVLERIELQFCDTEMLERDLAQLKDGLGRLLIVSHVDAKLPNGQSLNGRDVFIRQVCEAARRLDLPLCDPTQAMRRMGQGRAIADESSGLAHYTDDFARALVHEWFRDWFRPMTQDAMLHDPA